MSPEAWGTVGRLADAAVSLLREGWTLMVLLALVVGGLAMAFRLAGAAFASALGGLRPLAGLFAAAAGMVFFMAVLWTGPGIFGAGGWVWEAGGAARDALLGGCPAGPAQAQTLVQLYDTLFRLAAAAGALRLAYHVFQGIVAVAVGLHRPAAHAIVATVETLVGFAVLPVAGAVMARVLCAPTG